MYIHTIIAALGILYTPPRGYIYGQTFRFFSLSIRNDQEPCHLIRAHSGPPPLRVRFGNFWTIFKEWLL